MPTSIVRLSGDPTTPVPAGGSTVLEAVAGGQRADRLGAAFAAGYRAALRALVPGLTESASLCATEEGGAHPKAIATTVRDGRVTGRKTFVTLATEARRLLVVAREPSGRLRLVSVAADAPGVELVPLPPLAFAPEIPHAQAQLRDAPGDLLPGDGYDRYLKPFRTIEDIHVFAATMAYLFAAGRRAAWPARRQARLAALVAALAALADEDPLAPATHLALAGALDLGREVIDACVLPGEEGARWARDRPLLGVAEKVRALRLASACRALRLSMEGS